MPGASINKLAMCGNGLLIRFTPTITLQPATQIRKTYDPPRIVQCVGARFYAMSRTAIAIDLLRGGLTPQTPLLAT